MTSKLDLYDILGIVVPGALFIYLIPTCFRVPAELRSTAQFPDAFLVIVLTALAVFLGQLIQAVGSVLEPVLNRTWGGRPSNTALTSGLGERYLPADAAHCIRRKLQAAVGSDQSGTSLFLFAMQRAEGAAGSRASRFNALYAYHRALLVLAGLAIILFLAAMQWGTISLWSPTHKALLLLANSLLLLMLWHRTKQRSFYYVREVLLTAERVLDDRTASSSLEVTTSGE